MARRSKRTIDLTPMQDKDGSTVYGQDVERTCGNCRHLKARDKRRCEGWCAHIGPLGGTWRSFGHSPCAWHRLKSEKRPLAAPRQLARDAEDYRELAAMACWPQDMPGRKGWTDNAARQSKLIVCEAPRIQWALPYTPKKEG